MTDGVGVGKFVPDGGGVPVWELDGVMDGDCVGDTVFVGVTVGVDVTVIEAPVTTQKTLTL